MDKGPYDGLTYDNSEELCAKMAAVCDTALLAFSTGKDSIASWLQMRKYFRRIIPYYMYTVPGMKFVEESLKYYEEFFGCHIYRLPHPCFFIWMEGGMFQPANRLPALHEFYSLDDGLYDEDVIAEMIRKTNGLPETAYVGIGLRKTDSLIRRVTIDKNGAINHSRKTFYPVYDWQKSDMLHAFRVANVRLPVDYNVWGRTFDGLCYQYLSPLQQYFPEDYQLILKYFPLAELEFLRYGEADRMQKREDMT